MARNLLNVGLSVVIASLAIPPAAALGVTLDVDEIVSTDGATGVGVGGGGGAHFIATGAWHWVLNVQPITMTPLASMDPTAHAIYILTVVLDDEPLLCAGMTPLPRAEREQLAAAFRTTVTAVGMTAEEGSCTGQDGQALTVTTYSYELQQSMVNLADVGTMDATWECDKHDSNPGLGTTWVHDSTLEGTIYTDALNADLPFLAVTFDEPGKCTPDGTEEDVLSDNGVEGFILVTVPVCGGMSMQPTGPATEVDAGGAKVHIHTGWDIWGHFDIGIGVNAPDIPSFCPIVNQVNLDALGDLFIGT